MNERFMASRRRADSRKSTLRVAAERGIAAVGAATALASCASGPEYNYTALYDSAPTDPTTGEYPISGVVYGASGVMPDCPQENSRVSGVIIVSGHPYFQYASDPIVPGSCTIEPKASS
jgi:hypothetical protein